MFQILSLLQMTVTLRGLLSNSVTVDLVDFVEGSTGTMTTGQGANGHYPV